MKCYTVQDATKGIACVCSSTQDAIKAAKQIKSNNPRQQYRVYEFEMQFGQCAEYYVNRLVFDTRNIKD